MDNDKVTEVLFCPHCGNTSVQTLLLAQSYTATLYTIPTGEKKQEPAAYNVVRCETCSGVLVYDEGFDFSEFSATPFGNLAYPRQSEFSDAVPEQICTTYEEAVKIKSISSMAFTVLARRVLEEICANQGVTGGNLAQAIKEMAKKGVIPNTLAEASDLVRLVGNAGAHASTLNINALHASAIDDFIKAIIEYPYVAPARIDEFKKTYLNFHQK